MLTYISNFSHLQKSAFTGVIREALFVDWYGRYQGLVYRE